MYFMYLCMYVYTHNIVGSSACRLLLPQTQCHLSFSSQLGNWLFGLIVLNTHNMPSWAKSTEHTTDYKNYKLIKLIKLQNNLATHLVNC